MHACSCPTDPERSYEAFHHQGPYFPATLSPIYRPVFQVLPPLLGQTKGSGQKQVAFFIAFVELHRILIGSRCIAKSLSLTRP